jgi:sulfur-carrier protein adenylyltransferase/sulfurtransferase
MTSDLSPEELIRYKKHIMLPEIGLAGQQKLKESSVIVIGLGGLGSPVALYLAAAGVGRIGLVDSDVVDLSNLQRQIIHNKSDIGKKKVVSAGEKISALNPGITVEPWDIRFTAENSGSLIANYSLVVDCTDNLETRFWINQACVSQNKPFVHGAIYRFEGQVSVFDASNGPCYRCLYPTIPVPGQYPDPAENGLIGSLPGMVGSIQATEVVKLILNIGHPLVGKLLIIDALDPTYRIIKIVKNPTCPVCGS